MTSDFSAALNGFGLGASLIIAIGAQNAFVLKQGLKHEHPFIVALICAICDATLILIGTMGLGTLIEKNPQYMTIAAILGAAFLGVYGLKSFLQFFKNQRLDISKTKATKNLKKVITLTLAFSLLNPHVYLDTVVLLGSLAGQYPSHQRLIFAGGAMSSSFIWFFSLAYGARVIAPLFKKPKTWKVLDLVIAATMWTIAGSLVSGLMK